MFRKHRNRAWSGNGSKCFKRSAPAASKRSWRGRLKFESLESRLVLNGTPVISEFMAVNDGILLDEDGDDADWIEICNPTGGPVDLDGWSLTDSANDLTKWQFPAVTLPADGCLVVFASDKDRAFSGGQLHTNFKLSGSGEYLALVQPNGFTVASEYAPEFPDQFGDVSYGLSEDLTAQGYFTSPTPGEPNVGFPLANPTRSIIINEIMFYPPGEILQEEYIELYNRGTDPVDLTGWQFADGVDFVFPAASLDPGQYLVVAADVDAFAAKYPDVTPEVAQVIGGWTGRLSNRGEEIELVDAIGGRVDELTYSDEGDWAVRERGPMDFGHEGWVWSNATDGLGRSLELINPTLPNEYGQSWAASLPEQGTPGAANSVATSDVAPLILDVSHFPIIPNSDDPVTVSARAIEDSGQDVAMSVFYRQDGHLDFSQMSMRDMGDGQFAAILPAHPDGTVVEFYVAASDESANSRTWPAATQPDGLQSANLLYQVDDSFDPDAPWIPGSQPVYRLIMTEAERAELAYIGVGGSGGEQQTNAQMNATFISTDGVNTEVRYNAGIRNRGAGTRNQPPNNYRVNIPHDQPWHDVTAININSKYTPLQLVGAAIFRTAGLPGEDANAIQVRVNGQNLAENSSRMYGSYVHMQVYDSDFAGEQFPDDSNGNIYKASRYPWTADLSYRGTDPQSYIDAGYSKSTNSGENDWSDLIRLTDVLNNASDETYVEEVRAIVNVDQWMRWFAMQTLIGSNETNLGNGRGDDYAMYSGVEDPRFILLSHDLDTILGMGDNPFNVNQSIFLAANRLPVLDRFLRHPEFVARYYAQLTNLMETVFAPENIDPLIDNTLDGFVPEPAREAMKQFVVARNAVVRSQIPQPGFSVDSDLSQNAGYYYSTVDVAPIYGTADPMQTKSVLVDGQPVEWSPVDGTWHIGEGNPATTFSFVDRGSLWKYLDDGSDQGVAWYDPAFDDAAWAEGPAELGYGDGSESTQVGYGDDQDNKYPTTYFRHTFEIADLAELTSLTLGLRRDDGAVVYLNGTEVIRSNMPAGDVAFDTHADGAVPNSEETAYLTFAIAPAQLQAGENTLAVEIHQANLTSSDISFDLELSGREEGTSTGTGVALTAGVNRLLVETFPTSENAGADGTGNRLEQAFIDVWYDNGVTTNVSGTIDVDTTWDAAASPYLVTADVTVAPGATLTIGRGTTVFFDSAAGLNIDGRIVAEGSRYERIRLAPNPSGGNTWQGIELTNSMNDSLLSYVDMERGDGQGESILVYHSQLHVDNMTWTTAANRTAIEVEHPSLLVTNSHFPGISGEVVHGEYISGDEYLILEGNVFDPATGGGDVIDFLGADRPGPVLQVLNNVFLGGGDDGLDLDGTDAHIEGNLFIDFHDNASRTTTSNAIATGLPQTGESNRTEIVVVRNIFYDVDHAILLKEEAFATAVNNVFITVTEGVIAFDEPGGTSVRGPGRGAYLDGNIFYDTPLEPSAGGQGTFQYVTAETDLTVNRSIVAADIFDLGFGNILEDPRLADLGGLDFSLLPGSPALGTGPNGLDMGVMVPAGASITGEPPALTAATDATLTIDGPGVTLYRWRLNDGPWSSDTPTDTRIELTGLADGEYTVYVAGGNMDGIWQDESEPAVSKTWTVDASLARVRINEVLAANAGAVDHEGTLPDVIELVNDGGVAIDLSGMSISDDIHNPTRFVFPADTVLLPGEYLVLYADSAAETSGIHLGFALDADGEGVFLFDTAANGYAPLDSVQFGPQVTDLSIGRMGHDGDWALTQPTFGSANAAQRTGNPATLKINEWLASEQVRLVDDFVELYNPDPLPVALAGLYLTDNPAAQPGLHEIAPLSFVGGGQTVAFIADKHPENGANHLNFRLSADQEMIGLVDSEFRELDTVVYHWQTTDFSQGRYPNGADDFSYFQLPTPGQLNMAIESTTARPVEFAATWAYDQSGTDLGTQWREEAFDDSLWAMGAGLLHVEDSALPEPKGDPLTLGATTYYFRSHFTLDYAPEETVQLHLTPVLDDGAIFYLNGQEVLRIGMPEGEVAFDAWAARSIGNAGYEGPFTIPVDALRSGDNVLAVEVHQISANSSDIVFGLQMDATISTPTDTASINAALDRATNLLDGLRITELMYHPDNDDLEFVELQNVGKVPLELGGVEFTEGIEFTFPNMVLAAGQYTVIARDIDALTRHYGPGINIAGEYSGNLDNGGDDLTLELSEPSDVGILRFEFDDAWYPMTDGDGRSLVLANLQTPVRQFGDSARWQAGREEGGSPGRADGQWAESSIVINEVLTHTDVPIWDSIELYNPTEAEIDIGGWYLSDSSGNFLKYQIPGGTKLPAGEYIVFDETDFNPTPETPGPNDFALNGAHGDDVWLTQADASGMVTRVVDCVTFPATANGESLGRWPNGQGGLYPMEDVTLGEQNTGPRVGPVVISEVMYHPPADGVGITEDNLEYIEISNPTDWAVDLTQWQISGGVEFVFPGGASLAPGAALLVVPFDTTDAAWLAAFRAHYGLDGSVAIFGGYAGQLSNGGEAVTLARPDEPPAEEPFFLPLVLEDTLTYDDVAPWPVAADGSGGSLHRVDLGLFGPDPDSWIAMVPTPGNLPVDISAVVKRHIFYNNSAYDTVDPPLPTDDDLAIATDKRALLPGQPAGRDNYTSYDRGINGIMIDIMRLGDAANLGVEDFLFRLGNSNDLSTWTAAPGPESLTVRAQAGHGESDRVVLTWADDSIRGQWLEVTVLPNAHTGLATADVFYFGNAPGEAGDNMFHALVNATDEIYARNSQHGPFNPATIVDRYDFNRDRTVNAKDQIIARNAQTSPFSALRLITLAERAPGQLPAPAPETPLPATSSAGAVDVALGQMAGELSDRLAWACQLESLPARRSAGVARAAETAIDLLLSTYWQ